MHPKLSRTLATVIASLAASAAFADDVVTKAGPSYNGKIVAEDETTVTIDTPALGRMRIARSDIAKLHREDPPAEAPKEPGGTGDAAKPDAAPKPEAAPRPDEDAALSADERESRRKASRIKRRTDPLAAKFTAEPSKTTERPGGEEAKASIGGTQLAQAERGSWVVVYQPPRQFEPAPAGIQIGRRIYARLDSVGTASAWLTLRFAAGEQHVPVRLADVQRHAVMKPDASRVRMIEGIDKGAWLRLRLDDGSTVEGALQAGQEASVTLARTAANGDAETLDIATDRIVEADGLLRSASTRMTLADAVAGECVALTLWPDGREVVGVIEERNERFVTVQPVEGPPVRVALDGPVAEARRLPSKWRPLVESVTARTVAHVKSSEEFPDARVEHDLVGSVVALTAYAVSIDTPDGVRVVPFDAVTAFGPAGSDSEAAAARSMKKSERAYRVPVRPGDPAAKAAGLDPATGVSAVADGSVVRNVFVAAPFDGPVFGIRLGDRLADAQETTDLRFDAFVTPHRGGSGEPRPAEAISNSLEGVRVTLLVDAASCVSAIEVAAR